MLFNSYAFLLAFLPVTLIGYFLLGRLGRVLGCSWLALASLFFYGWWDYRYIPLLIASICGNYLLGGHIARHAGTPMGKRGLIIGAAVNLGLLAYYKYLDFFLATANTLLGTTWLAGIVLPIGISFFTFTQIAFLADAYAGKVKEYRFTSYMLFVSYFPHLIAGPVLHHKEMMPQFDDDRNYRPHASDIAIGLSIFAIGLAKKVLIADNLAQYAGPFFAQVEQPTLLVAWSGTLAYTFQLYFDFSGYSDMAIGLSRLFGVKLPLNFNSPYKATNIADFWRRWHMTLSRFLRDYLYIPLGGNRHGPVRRHINLVTTMVLGGLWHGAGWNFVVWGALHGFYLVVEHAWRDAASKMRVRMPSNLSRPLGVLLTFLCVVIGWVYFRATDVGSANRIVLGLFGANGVALPEAVMSRLTQLFPTLQHWSVQTFLGGGMTFIQAWTWIFAGAALSFGFPNTQEIMGRFEPALMSGAARTASTRWSWSPRPGTAVAIGLLFGVGLLALSRPTVFLYFQF